MTPFPDMISLILKQILSPQVLQRLPEPESVTTGAENVQQYSQAMMSHFPVYYGLALEMIDGVLSPDARGSALDLASGPGLFTGLLAEHLGFERVQGLDLSQPMVEIASRRAQAERQAGRVSFQRADITRLHGLQDDSADLANFTFAAHHMPDLETVRRVLMEMDRVVRPGGAVFVMDGVRLRTRGLTEHFMECFGQDYLESGMHRMYEDLRHSMYAYWTVEELRSAVPRDSKRRWCQWVPFGFPSSQILVGFPRDRKHPLLRSFSADENPLIRALVPQWEARRGKSWTRDAIHLWNLSHALMFSRLNRPILLSTYSETPLVAA